MKTSRRDGILVLSTKKPYEIAIKGNLEKRNLLVCHDINRATEGLAYDLEQALMNAIIEAAERFQKQSSGAKQITDQADKENQDFFEKDCPSPEEIANMNTSLSAQVLMAKNVSLRNVMSIFDELVLSGLIKCESEITMTEPIWSTVHRVDKMNIAFSYMSFFVNPLQQLLIMSTEMEKSKEKGAIEG